MPKPTVPSPVPPPPFSKWVIIATAVSFVAMIAMFFLQVDSDDYAPDGPLGQPKEAVETSEPPDKLRSEAVPPAIPKPDPFAGEGTLAGRYLAGRHAQTIREMGDAARFLKKAMTLSPDTTTLHRRVFLLNLADGHIKQATQLAADVLKENPKAAIANLVVITANIVDAHYAQAQDRIGALAEGGLNTYMAPLLDAWVGVALGEKADAAIVRLKPLSKEGTKVLYKLHSAIINDVAGNTDRAERDYQAAIKAQGGPSLRVIELLGNLYERSQRPDKAQELYEEHLKTTPLSPLARAGIRRLANKTIPDSIIRNATDGAAESFFGIATSLSQQNARETALVFARLALYLRADFPVMQMLLGNILQADQQYQDANDILAGIDRNSPYSWSARLSMADNLDDLGKPEEAEKQLREMAAEEPEIATPLTRLGDTLRGHEQFAKAVEAYDQAMLRIGEPQSHHWSLLYARGIALERSGQWDRAEPDFLKALEFKPDQPMVLNYLGYTWIDKGINLDRATGMIKKAVALKPTDGYIADSLGWAHFRLGNFDDAAKEMERAVGLRAEDPVINDHLGDAYWRVGRTNEARFQWQRVLTLNPDDDLAAQVREKLKNGLKPIDKSD